MCMKVVRVKKNALTLEALMGVFARTPVGAHAKKTTDTFAKRAEKFL